MSTMAPTTAVAFDTGRSPEPCPSTRPAWGRAWAWAFALLAATTPSGMSAAETEASATAVVTAASPTEAAPAAAEAAETSAPSAASAQSGTPDEPQTRFPAAARIVALGDWHGDLAAARAGLRLVGAIDERDRWIGGPLVVVQTGDQLDRGDEEQAILDLLDRLQDEARAAGGAVHALLGNHELMNVEGDFRYVTGMGWADFADAGIVVDPADSVVTALPGEQRPRAAAFRPGGRYALRLAERNVVTIVGRTLFVHGGILPHHLVYGLERLNRETRAWLRGEATRPTLYEDRDDPVWARHYSDEPDASDCDLLSDVLAAADCDRMVVGHTVQEGGITPYCDERVWCIDTGAAAAYGGAVEALEITDAGIRVLVVPADAVRSSGP